MLWLCYHFACDQRVYSPETAINAKLVTLSQVDNTHTRNMLFSSTSSDNLEHRRILFRWQLSGTDHFLREIFQSLHQGPWVAEWRNLRTTVGDVANALYTYPMRHLINPATDSETAASLFFGRFHSSPKTMFREEFDRCFRLLQHAPHFIAASLLSSDDFDSWVSQGRCTSDFDMRVFRHETVTSFLLFLWMPLENLKCPFHDPRPSFGPLDWYDESDQLRKARDHVFGWFAEVHLRLPVNAVGAAVDALNDFTKYLQQHAEGEYQPNNTPVIHWVSNRRLGPEDSPDFGDLGE